MTATVSPDTLRALPKVELHVHLEGSLAAARIVELAADAGVPLPRPPEQLFEFTDLDAFLELLTWTCGLVGTDEQAERVAYDFARRAHLDGTMYAEVIVNPTHWGLWNLGALVGALSAGFERAAVDGLADCRLLLSLARAQSGDDALALVRWMLEHRDSRLLGLSIDGNEARAGRTGERFAPAFHLARAEGLGCVAHAGESSGPGGVLDALELLEVHRIDHGVRAAEDPEVVARLADAGVPLDICLSSNLTILYDSITEHPIDRLLAAGVPVTLSTDDPAFLDVDLTGELLLASSHLGWGLGDVASVVRTAIDASFCGPARKEGLHAALDDFVAADGESITR